MSTFKERQERKQARYQQYADNAKRRAGESHDKAHGLLDVIPIGQPILVGHHSEAGHRKRLSRADNAMRKTCEESDKAKYWQRRASHLTLESELENRGFAVGDEGIAKWTNCNRQWEVEAHIIKVNDRSLKVKIHHDVIEPARNGYPERLAYPKGWTIKIALTQSGTFTNGNSFTKED